MSKTKSGYILYSIVVSLLQQVALVFVIIWLPPQFGVELPVWSLALLMPALGAYSLTSMIISARVLNRKPATGAEAMIGTSVQCAKPLHPSGYVRVGGELWKACTLGRTVNAGESVSIVKIQGLTLYVEPLTGENSATTSGQ